MIVRIFSILSLFIVTPAMAQNFDHSAWGELVERNVRSSDNGAISTVDYAEFKRKRSELKSYLTALESIDQATFDSWATEEQLAFLINAYNAWTVELIVESYPDVNSIRELGTITTSPWQKKFIPFLGGTRSLDEIEHEMIRGSGRYNEPRIHFAVNCASIGCPALIDSAFEAATLDAQLEDATKAFLTDRTRNRLESEGLAISSIFDWYRDDFEQGWRDADTLEDFLALYADSLDLTAAQTESLVDGDIDIGFTDYDWRLNDITAPAASASSGGFSPIWLIRSFPIPAAIAGLVLLLMAYALVRLIRKRRRAVAP
jgi:hypothetical protein